ncbi:MAG: hypothetical protein JSS81_20065 [Acidobacteria bacterium]|nr:hypothetical protein [Acidobacteriota bacterium]
MCLFLPAPLALAFDTAPHYDLTRTVLAERGFGGDAIGIAQVENWLTDYYSSSPTIAKTKGAEFEKLHCDNLYTTAEVAAYWARLLANVRAAVREAARDGDETALLAALGMSLHVVQDYYAHSNWVETHPRGAFDFYRTETYLSAPPAPDARLFTGKYPADRKLGPSGGAVPAGALAHGDYRTGLNHDSPVRPGWDEAYVFAYAASHELVELVEKWTEEARPGFWERVRSLTLAAADRAALDFDLRAAQNLSMWIRVRDADGHWKGDKSGLARFFDTFTSKWVGRDSSRFVKLSADGRLLTRLAAGLYTREAAPALPKTKPFALNRRAVLVRTTRIAETDDVGRLEPAIDPSGKADFYAVFTIGGQLYRERVIQNEKSAIDPWFEIHFVDAGLAAVPVNIAVLDEDDWDAGGKYRDDVIDINPQPGKTGLDLVFHPLDGSLTGDVTGVHATRATAFLTTGAKPDKNRAAFSCFIWQAALR